ncbi:MAG: tetratricopeptide repeat protein [Sphaerospermopsis kisseleviana]
MKRFISTAAATVTLVLSLSAQAISAVGKAHDQIKASPSTALDRQSSIIMELNSEQDEETYLNLGVFCLLFGNWQGAIENFDQAIRINPNVAEAYGIRGIARLQLGDVKGATEDLQKAADIFQHKGKIAEYQEVMNIIKEINNKSTDAVIS